MTGPKRGGHDQACHHSLSLMETPWWTTHQVRESSKLQQSSPRLAHRKGFNLFLGNISSDLCPVKAMLNYLVVQKERPLHLRNLAG